MARRQPGRKPRQENSTCRLSKCRQGQNDRPELAPEAAAAATQPGLRQKADGLTEPRASVNVNLNGREEEVQEEALAVVAVAGEVQPSAATKGLPAAEGIPVGQVRAPTRG